MHKYLILKVKSQNAYYAVSLKVKSADQEALVYVDYCTISLSGRCVRKYVMLFYLRFLWSFTKRIKGVTKTLILRYMK